MNNVNLIGNISTDLFTNETKNGKTNVWFRLAVDGRPGPNGEKNTKFFPVQVWNGQAEALLKYQGKGSRIAVEGLLDQYKDKDGNEVNYIVGRQVTFLGRPKGQAADPVDDTAPVDDIPF